MNLEEEEELTDSNFIQIQKLLSKRVILFSKELKRLNKFCAKTSSGDENRESMVTFLTSEMPRLAPAIKVYEAASAKAGYLKDISGGVLSQNAIISFIQAPENKSLLDRLSQN